MTVVLLSSCQRSCTNGDDMGVACSHLLSRQCAMQQQEQESIHQALPLCLYRCWHCELWWWDCTRATAYVFHHRSGRDGATGDNAVAVIKCLLHVCMDGLLYQLQTVPAWIAPVWWPALYYPLLFSFLGELAPVFYPSFLESSHLAECLFQPTASCLTVCTCSFAMSPATLLVATVFSL